MKTNPYYTPTPQEQEMIRIMEKENTSWREGQVWVTDRVGFWMRQQIKDNRRNYFGIFEQEFDPVTGRKKIFVPLTEWTVENVDKNIDVDTNSIHADPMKPDASVAAEMLNYILRNRLEEAGFGKILNMVTLNMIIDGTAFMKAWKETGEDGKAKLCLAYQDRLHMILDPSVQEMEQSTGRMEENIITLPEFQNDKAYDDWANRDAVIGEVSVDRTNMMMNKSSTSSSEIPYVRIYERYGWAPKFVLTGKEEDKKKYVFVLSIASELGTNPVIHLIKEVDQDPYGTFKYKDVLNRFDGRGIPEKLQPAQQYMNETVNTRLNTARVVQLGLWRIDPSVTSKQLKDLFSTTAIKAPMGQIERLNTGTVDASSYKDEDVANDWAKRVTQTTNEDEVAASKPATNALIEERGANKGYDLIIENFYLSLAKFIKEKVIPIIIDTLEDGEIERITGDSEALQKLEAPFLRNAVRQANQDAMMMAGRPLYNSPQEEEMMMQQLSQELTAQYGNKRFIPIIKEAFDTEYEVRIDPAQDVVNKGVLVNELNSVMGTLISAGVPIGEMKEVIQELFDTMGLPGQRLAEKIGTTQMMMPNTVDPNQVASQNAGVPIESTQVPQPA